MYHPFQLVWISNQKITNMIWLKRLVYKKKDSLERIGEKIIKLFAFIGRLLLVRVGKKKEKK